MSREAMRRALEALEILDGVMRRSQRTDAAITALKQALAEPEQEPDGISWLKRDSGYFTAPTPRKPLTDDEIVDIYKKWDATPGVSMADFARAIERAHGIGEQHE